MRTLVAKLLILTAIIFLIALVADRVYRQLENVDYPLPVVWFSPEKAEPYQLVAVGNSHAQSGITFRGFNTRGLELFGVAQRFDFDVALLKQHHQEIAPGAVVIIPVTPISFSHRKADQRDGLQTMFYGRLAPFLIPYLNLSDYLQTQWVPFLRSGYALRQRYATQVQEEVAAKEKWVDPTATASTSVATPSAVVEDPFLSVETIKTRLSQPDPTFQNKHDDNIAFIFHKWYETDEFGPEYFAYNRQALEKLIAYTLEQGWRPILITIPITTELEDALLDDYMQTYLYDNLAQTDIQGAEYLDLSNLTDLSKNNFFYGNADHLNSDGATVFSYYLLQELIQRGYLDQTVDGYDYQSP